ncbi:hypothetical protein AVEN_218081-1 [Araneus ventricosus]|uniref:Uncharacterized protein n=1 Tax=Araneus ventricosus TaxID=182803 RepID=A0A4Y2HP67_ARAVE|nr:hypothetical protein AVEN_218081-1 [Araneus ventricosus]
METNLQRRSSGSTHYSSVIQVQFFYSHRTGRYITWNHLVHSSVSPLLIEISRKGLHFLEFSICLQARQNGCQVCHQSRPGCCSHPIFNPVKLSSQP